MISAAYKSVSKKVMRTRVLTEGIRWAERSAFPWRAGQ